MAVREPTTQGEFIPSVFHGSVLIWKPLQYQKKKKKSDKNYKQCECVVPCAKDHSTTIFARHGNIKHMHQTRKILRSPSSCIFTSFFRPKKRKQLHIPCCQKRFSKRSGRVIFPELLGSSLLKRSQISNISFSSIFPISLSL